MTRTSLLWEITRWELLRWLKLKDLLRTVIVSSVLGLAVWGGLAAFEHYNGGPVRIGILDRQMLPFELPEASELETPGPSPRIALVGRVAGRSCGRGEGKRRSSSACRLFLG
jgi:hypothetical protein